MSFTVAYHGVQVILFLGMLIYIFKIKRLQERVPLTRNGDNETEWRDGIRCSLFLYSPLMANVKFLGYPTALLVVYSNYANYFNHYYFAINFILEALISSGPITFLQFIIMKEDEVHENLRTKIILVVSVIFSLICFLMNLGFGIYLWN